MTRIDFGGVKWLALVLMIGDHFNAVFFDRSLPVISELARVVMPLFAMVLGWNIAHANEAARLRTLRRLMGWGIVAQPFYMLALDGAWWPLNVLIALGVGVWTVHLAEKRSWVPAVAVFLVGGAITEFLWAAPAVVVAMWAVERFPRTAWTAAGLGAALGLLVAFSGTWYPLAALPLFCLIPWLRVRLPRAQALFYAVYPAHLALFALAASVAAQPTRRPAVDEAAVQHREPQSITAGAARHRALLNRL